MLKTTMQDLKNLVKVAKYTGKPENFKVILKNKERDGSIVVMYYPKKSTGLLAPEYIDDYPFWKITIRNEEEESSVHISDSETGRREVRSIYNKFMSQ